MLATATSTKNTLTLDFSGSGESRWTDRASIERLLAWDGLPTVVYEKGGRTHYGILSSVQRESGSGRSFNLIVDNAGVEDSVYVRVV